MSSIENRDSRVKIMNLMIKNQKEIMINSENRRVLNEVYQIDIPTYIQRLGKEIDTNPNEFYILVNDFLTGYNEGSMNQEQQN